MDIATTNADAIAKIKARCHAARMSMTELCREAKVGRATVWRADSSPQSLSVRTLRKLEAALDQAEASAKVL